MEERSATVSEHRAKKRRVPLTAFLVYQRMHLEKRCRPSL